MMTRFQTRPPMNPGQPHPLDQDRIVILIVHSWRIWMVVTAISFLGLMPLHAERINHEGRILGAMPVVTNAVLFNTPEADAIMSALQIFPRDHAWNEDISRRPVLANSDFIITNIVGELQASRRTLRAFYEMNFVLVPTNQPSIPITFFYYGDQSDPSPYPIPTNTPVEGWPRETGSLTLDQWQRDINNVGGDRHSIIVQPGTGDLWETWLTQKTNSLWRAANGAKFNLNSNAQRPAGWTSADAAGLSMLGGLVRYDECERGMVEHAIRIIVKHTRRQYLYPASHHASVPSTLDPNVPAMGQRLRLKAGFVIPSNWTKQEKAVLLALKKYGAIVADNGNFFSISVAPDQRFPGNAFDHFSTIGITNFEAIVTTQAGEGPRSPGAPTANAGADHRVRPGSSLQLDGRVMFSQPSQVSWKFYSGPAPVTFDDPARTNAIATFGTNGTYTLMLSTDDGIHAVAYDAMVVTVADNVRLNINCQGGNVLLNWTGGTAPFDVEGAIPTAITNWTILQTTSQTNVVLPMNVGARLFRIRAQP
ncbi:MAG: hypothetical protein H7X97_03785 [Opitutaceae bacterium]|nr:hypothetical protein [Verrucomicrobiales bacterium]